MGVFIITFINHSTLDIHELEGVGFQFGSHLYTPILRKFKRTSCFLPSVVYKMSKLKDFFVREKRSFTRVGLASSQYFLVTRMIVIPVSSLQINSENLPVYTGFQEQNGANEARAYLLFCRFLHFWISRVRPCRLFPQLRTKCSWLESQPSGPLRPGHPRHPLHLPQRSCGLHIERAVRQQKSHDSRTNNDVLVRMFRVIHLCFLSLLVPLDY